MAVREPVPEGTESHLAAAPVAKQLLAAVELQLPDGTAVAQGRPLY